MADPVATRHDQAHELRPDNIGTEHGNAQQNNPACWRQSGRLREFAEVFIKFEQTAFVVNYPCQHLLITVAASVVIAPFSLTAYFLFWR
jgi:hypothetical protein